MADDLKYFNNKFTNSFDDFQAQLRYNDDIRILNLTSQDAISGVIIGAGSVVTKDILEIGKYAGNPAIKISQN